MVKKRSKEAEPLLAMIKLLVAGGELTIARAQGISGYERAAVARKLNQIEEAFVQVRTRKDGRTKVWFWKEQADAPILNSQLQAVAVARAFAAPLRGTGLGDSLNQLHEDLLRTADAPGAHAGIMDRLFVVQTRLSAQVVRDPNVLDATCKALVECRRLHFEYTHFKGELRRVVLEPLSLVLTEDGMCCYGECVDGDDVDHLQTRRMYNLTRIDRMKLGAPFSYPSTADYDPRRIFRNVFGTFLGVNPEAPPPEVVLHFRPNWAGYLGRTRLHESAVTQSDDLGVTVKLRVHVTYGLVHWIRGHGTDITVVSPTNLRNWVESGLGTEYKDQTIQSAE